MKWVRILSVKMPVVLYRIMAYFRSVCWKFILLIRKKCFSGNRKSLGFFFLSFCLLNGQESFTRKIITALKACTYYSLWFLVRFLFSFFFFFLVKICSVSFDEFYEHTAQSLFASCFVVCVFFVLFRWVPLVGVWCNK